jgi:hypothetical protein
MGGDAFARPFGQQREGSDVLLVLLATSFSTAMSRSVGRARWMSARSAVRPLRAHVRLEGIERVDAGANKIAGAASHDGQLVLDAGRSQQAVADGQRLVKAEPAPPVGDGGGDRQDADRADSVAVSGL